MDVYALFEEESPQYGTSRLIGIYDSVELAEKNKSNRRCFVRVVVLNENHLLMLSTLASNMPASCKKGATR
ncbi:hypothetical protein [Aeromonas veronii]|uniref:hypothetical protein n=1 Tax=Aeromonas veronii TaxID=654 RepID=UPI002443B5A2|nr:hypothetical protein [Aeromonas veronii]